MQSASQMNIHTDVSVHNKRYSNTRNVDFQKFDCLYYLVLCQSYNAGYFISQGTALNIIIIQRYLMVSDKTMQIWNIREWKFPEQSYMEITTINEDCGIYI